jgi:dipicolinate synthase subunit B
MKNIYFIPFGQDNPIGKPKSLVANWDKLVSALEEAMEGRQIQPIIN